MLSRPVLTMVSTHSTITNLKSYFTTAHRAMEDVKAMVAVFSSDLLKNVLSQLTFQSQAQILSYWQDRSKEWLDAQQFVTKMGKVLKNNSRTFKQGGTNVRQTETHL